jgi:small subunit ribosomal protein S4
VRQRGQPSEYVVRLRAKQRVKRQYGMLEHNFRRDFTEVSRSPGDPGENSLLLEQRLDTAVYRLGFALT